MEDTENRAIAKMERAIEEVKKLLVPIVSGVNFSNFSRINGHLELVINFLLKLIRQKYMKFSLVFS